MKMFCNINHNHINCHLWNMASSVPPILEEFVLCYIRYNSTAYKVILKFVVGEAKIKFTFNIKLWNSTHSRKECCSRLPLTVQKFMYKPNLNFIIVCICQWKQNHVCHNYSRCFGTNGLGGIIWQSRTHKWVQYNQHFGQVFEQAAECNYVFL
jgi:hypothetical protein